MLSSSKSGLLFSEENSSKLLLTSEVTVPRTLQILFGYNPTSEARSIKLASSFLGRINANIPFSESR